MKNVELVRQRLVAGLGAELRRVRIWLSSLDGGAEPADRLRDTDGADLLADLVETTMEHLGHATPVAGGTNDRRTRTQARKAASKEM